MGTNPFAAVLEKAERKAEENTVVNDCDYRNEDGLLVCGKCHTPKQIRHYVEMLGEWRTPYCMCECESEAYEREKKLRKLWEQKQERLKMIPANRSKAFPDVDESTAPEDDMRNWKFENDDGRKPKYIAIAKKYVETFETHLAKGAGLMFYGTVGTGKSFLSGCIANALLDKGYKVCMTSFGRISSTYFSAKDKQAFMDSLNEFELLIIDDFGAERGTEFMNEIVYNVLDARSRSGKPLIMTTNLTGAELTRPQGIAKERIYSRALVMCTPLEIAGENRREQKALQRAAEMKELLGF